MRQKNRLYTVNKFNKPLFAPEGNLFLNGGNANALAQADYQKNPWNYTQDYMYGNGPSITDQYLNSKNAFGISKAQNPFSKANLGIAPGGSALKGVGSAMGSALIGGVAGMGAQIIGDTIGGIAGAIGNGVGNLLGGGKKSGAGNAVQSVTGGLGNIVGGVPIVGGLAKGALNLVGGVVGGGINALVGTKIDQEKLNAAKEGTTALNNFSSTASSLDDIKGPQAQLNVQDAYKGGVFKKGWARKRNEQLKEARTDASLLAQRGILNNAENLMADSLNEELANYSAYGGPLSFGGGALGLMQQNRYFDTIDKRSEAIAGKGQTMQTGFTGGAKTFADGGLKSAFLDEFGSDPIGAAVRYNRGLEALAAQEEAKQIEAQREAEYADMQKKLSSLETENQGLQALMTANPSVNPLPVVPEIPTSSHTPSRATSKRSFGNSNWDYIEDQLRRSGKFNDTQIQGIKYNLQRESSIDPTVVGDGGSAFGLGQWHGSRKPKDMSLEGQTRHLIDTLSAFDGKEHWINKKDYEGFLNARTPEEAHYYLAKGYERPRANIVAKVKRDSDMSLKNLSAFGGELGTNITDWTNGLLYIDKGGSHEENPLDGVPMGLDPQGIPNLVEEGETVYDDYVFSDRMKVPFFMYKELGLGGVMKKKGKEMSFADASKKLAQESEKRPNDPISRDSLQASLAKLAEIQETERMKKQAEEYMGLEGYACGGKLGHKYKLGSGLHSRKVVKNSSNMNYDGAHADGITWNFNPHEDEVREQMGFGNTSPVTEAARQAIAMEGYIPEYNDESADAVDFLTNGIDSRLARENGPKTYGTWMRYAPAVGAGVMTLTDALGLTNKPDYTYAAGIEAAARAAGYAPDISYKPIGDYMRYTPLDRQYYINQLMANSRATDRALSNSPSPSRAAGLLANSYNTTLSLGNLARQAEEYNRAQYERTKEFNRKTNMFNSQMDLEAAMANARYQQAAKQMGLSGLAQAAALREQIDARTGAAKSANLSNFLTSLGNIGRENFAMNQINTDRSRHYYGNLSGNVGGYKSKKKSCGGKLNRK